MKSREFSIFSRYVILLLASTIVISSCKTTKTSEKVISKPTTYKKILSDLNQLSPDYNSMASDIRLDADIDGSSYRATGSIRHVKNKGIFISVRKLGFEIGQVLITQDSFFVLNRWEKEFIQEPIAIIEKEYNIRGEFKMVEELLTELPQVSIFDKNKKTTIENGNHRIETNSLYPGIGLLVWMDNQNQPVRQSFYQDHIARGVRMKYMQATSRKLVLERELHTENIESEIHVKLEYRNPTFDQTTLPAFRVPSHYTRRRL